MKYKAITGILTGLMAFNMFCSSVTAYADEGSEKWNFEDAMYIKQFADCEDCNLIRTGGTNRLDGKIADSIEEAKELDNYLAMHDYVLANTENREITEEDAEMLKTIGFCGSPCFDDEKPLYSKGEYYKLYINRPSLQTAREQWRENNHVLDFHIMWEISESSVLIDYIGFKEEFKIGKEYTIDEINSNLPDLYEEAAGFVEFSSSVDAEILLHLKDSDYYYRLYIPKGETLVRMRSNHYELVEINHSEVAVGDEILENGNYFVVYYQTKDEPYKINLKPLEKRDGISSIDISDKPDCSWEAVYEDVDVKDYDDVIVEEDGEKESENTNKKNGIGNIIIVLILFGIVGVLVYLIIRKRKNR